MAGTILVTGAAGFIGSHVCDALLTNGNRVVGLDNLNDYYDPVRKRANLREVAAAAERFTFVEGDVRDSHLLAGLFQAERFDRVVHLAAMAGVRASLEDPSLYYDVNLRGTLNVLEAGRAAGLPPLTLASTSSVYGRTAQVPFVESDGADRPLAPYAASKRAAEMLAFTYHHLYGQAVTVLRFFTVYGPRGRPDMMAYKVLDNILFGKSVPLYNGGRLYRDWTYVGDVTAGVVAAAQRDTGYEIVNLGRGQPVLLSDFIAAIEELTGRRATLSTAPMPDSDMSYTYADISKARNLLGYNPTVSVREGVRLFWQWYRTAILDGSDAAVTGRNLQRTEGS